MRTFGELQSYVQDIINDSSTKIQTTIQRSANIVVNMVRRKLSIPYEIQSTTISTVAGQQAYFLPVKFIKLVDISVTVGSTAYFPSPVNNRDQWNKLNSDINETSSDIPSYYFINPTADGNKIELWPTPSSADNTITVGFWSKPKHLLSTDFIDKSAGTLSINNAASAVTGVGTSFASSDVDRYIRFDDDGYWYRITAVTDATHLTINRPFEGDSIAGGNYLIGTVPHLPEEAMEIIARFIMQRIWEKREDATISGGKASYFEDRAKKELKELWMELQNQNDSPDVTVLDANIMPINPNDDPLIT